ncbi:MAG: 3-hydroxyacyl-CoA dehydrogenase/enoyl-CoA hydratase/3-hydroxybutyryl-CoA epimerase [Porticoccus sp.]|jgi:3-hydroxyacyl-CoA dehydrogenase/enoyl-CoA hydratase/3-hydroxybutyryl-CoA epimerase/enoyl-CoA isomerase
MFQANNLKLQSLNDGYVELHFDAAKGSVNVFNQATIAELLEALLVLGQQSNVKGLLLTSGKGVFVAGADITEFDAAFNGTETDRRGFLSSANQAFNKIESLPFPTVVAINGFALGGGFEICLACDFRVMSSKAQVGVPETKLGIIPGWGGTVRLPRLIGFDNAVQWIATGDHKKAAAALRDGAVDAVVAPELLRDEALGMLVLAAEGQLDYQSRREQKQSPLLLNDIELGMSIRTCRDRVAAKAGPNYPAPVAAVEVLAKAARMSRDEALEVEFQAFSDLSQTPQCRALVGMFLNDQYISSIAKKYGKKSTKTIEHTTALGAGIMGGGIAYQNAIKGFPVLMKDINTDSLALGMSEANKLLAKRVDRRRMSALDAGNVLSRIMPSLSYEGIGNTDIVIEAVVENAKIKGIVLAEVEDKLAEDAILVSNTSTISIDQLADNLKRPENFCGMHFFNPVHAMPLVEVIRGSKTSEGTLAAVVAHAQALGKKPIVVNDCPGFLVNRVLFPAVFGFDMMIVDGVDFQQVDRVMEAWGWPMGPAYLMDVVGIDTAVHCFPSILEGYPERMNDIYDVSPTKLLFENSRLGQKNGKGYYVYETDKRGKPKKSVDESVYALLKPHTKASQALNDEDMVARFMIPMCIELAHCLEEGVVGSPTEADMAVVYGLGFPAFRGGIFRWMDEIGLDKFCQMAGRHHQLGKLYEPTERMREMAVNGQRYYS